MRIADLHIHSKYSRATSRDCDASHLELWARNKGIHLVGTGDFTHPAWRKELTDALEPAEEGLYRLKAGERLACHATASVEPRFVISGEISTIYKKDGKTRKVHHVVLLPGLAAAEALAHRLEAIGNLHSDGRPILGLDSRDLLEIIMETCPQAVYIPAHIWTPHFSLFGAFSGFDTLEECYGDLTPHVHAVETGLSSDPPMNRSVSMLDGLTLVSNSDAHSPGKLGREANLLDIPLDYAHLKAAIETGEGFWGTLEFFPEEGKYHLDGHRACGQRLEPAETLRHDGKCPVCGKKITIGVLHRVEELADRAMGSSGSKTKPFESLMPLVEVIASATGVSAASKKTWERYVAMLRKLGPELSILREVPIEDIERTSGYAIGEGVRRLRQGRVERLSGYDGEYGIISLFVPGELQMLEGQQSMLGLEERKAKEASPEIRDGQAHDETGMAKEESVQEEKAEPEAVGIAPQGMEALNQEQHRAVTAEDAEVAVVAGPGTGKTKTLVERILWLMEVRGVPPGEITAVTFTNQAAQEMRERLDIRLGGQKQLQGLTVGTFHAICRSLLEESAIAGEAEGLQVIKAVLKELHREDLHPITCLRMISAVKNGKPLGQVGLDPAVYDAYCARLQASQRRDMDDLLLDALEVDTSTKPMFRNLLVDEFQDMNPVQHKLVRHWCGPGGSLFVIGDPDQSIYGFRGADAGCFEALKRERPNLRMVALKENYRSTALLLEGALTVIGNNPGGKRRLEATRGPGAPIRLVTVAKPFEAMHWIAKESIRMVGGVDMLGASASGERRHGARSFGDMAILCRTRHLLGMAEVALRRESIPCTIYGRDDFLIDKAVAGALAFFEALLTPQGTPLQTCLKQVYRVPQALIQRVQSLVAGQGALQPSLLREELGGYEVLVPWLYDVETFLPLAGQQAPRKLLQLWEEVHGKNRAMQQLQNASVCYDHMPTFLRMLSTGEEADVRRASSGRYETDAVRLMTLHGAKGLEFPVVFLVGDAFPRDGRQTEPEKMQEERRLFFVGMTRAKEELVITCSEENLRFVQELPQEVQQVHIRKVGPKEEQLRLF